MPEQKQTLLITFLTWASRAWGGGLGLQGWASEELSATREPGGPKAPLSCRQEVITEVWGLLSWGLQAHMDLLSFAQTLCPPKGGTPRP